MASLTSLPAVFVLLIVQIHARESQFFSKVTGNPSDFVELPDRQQSLVDQQEEQPEFETETQSGYGLYGHETGLFPPGTETKSGVQTHTPGTYSSEKYFNNDRPKTEQFQSNKRETFYNSKEKFNPGSDDEDLLSFDNTDKSSNDDLLNFDDETDANANAKTESFYNGGKTERYAQTQKGKRVGGGESYYSNFGSRLAQKETDGVNDNEVRAYEAYRAQLQSRGGSGRQGMSDTRFLANGRYYYDLNQERSQSQYGGRKTYNSNYSATANYDASEFGNKAYQGDKAVGGGESYKNNFDDNSGGEKYEFNTMEEYERSRQNQYDP